MILAITLISFYCFMITFIGCKLLIEDHYSAFSIFYFVLFWLHLWAELDDIHFFD